jgi:hypothetical protein
VRPQLLRLSCLCTRLLLIGSCCSRQTTCIHLLNLCLLCV